MSPLLIKSRLKNIKKRFKTLPITFWAKQNQNLLIDAQSYSNKPVALSKLSLFWSYLSRYKRKADAHLHLYSLILLAINTVLVGNRTHNHLSDILELALSNHRE